MEAGGGETAYVKALVIKMLKQKHDVKFISKVTGVSEEEIYKVRAKADLF
jgi:hypothetical protein